jgi:N6-adenosine-specific RNA methylase IME4
MANFRVIIADPCWEMSDKLTMSDVKRGAASHYSTLSIGDLKSLKVNDLADPNGTVLCLWVLNSMLQEGLDVMNSWGFTHKQIYVWNKVKKDIGKVIKKEALSTNPKLDDNILSFGMGRLFRGCNEICLIGINNTNVYKQLKNKSQRNSIFEENKGHSIKPDNLHASIEKMFPGDNHCELFARRMRKGWVCVGNEAPMTEGLDIRDSIELLKSMTNETVQLIKNGSGNDVKSSLPASDADDLPLILKE